MSVRTLPFSPRALCSAAPPRVHDSVAPTIQDSGDVDTAPVGPTPLGDTLRQTSASLPEPSVEDHLRRWIRGQIRDDGTVEVDLVARDDDNASTVPTRTPLDAHVLGIMASEKALVAVF
jgi:hypothetical protein